jgi:hypothetical protein
LGNKKLAKALATMVEESDAAEMEVQWAAAAQNVVVSV